MTVETDSWRAQTKPVCTRTKEKGTMSPRGTEPDLPMSVQESLAEPWVDSGLLWGKGH